MATEHTITFTEDELDWLHTALISTPVDNDVINALIERVESRLYPEDEKVQIFYELKANQFKSEYNLNSLT